MKLHRPANLASFPRRSSFMEGSNLWWLVYGTQSRYRHEASKHPQLAQLLQMQDARGFILLPEYFAALRMLRSRERWC
jgi:hypothetical protein